MKKKSVKKPVIIISAIILILILGGIIIAISFFNTVPKNLDGFAQCLASKNVTMYGAYWCSHCQNQKKMFGDSWAYMNYVECDGTDPAGQPELCDALGIEGYPTWIINGVKVPGEQKLETLSRITGCNLE